MQTHYHMAEGLKRPASGDCHKSTIDKRCGASLDRYTYRYCGWDAFQVERLALVGVHKVWKNHRTKQKARRAGAEEQNSRIGLKPNK